MHESPKLTSFIALRAKGWSLAHIAHEISVPKSTLWEWDNKYQDQVYQLKNLQLEKLQEKYLPTYEEELSRLRSFLDRIETALEQKNFDYMQPGGLLQMALQLRTRMAKIRDNPAMRKAAGDGSLTPCSFTGRVTHQSPQDLLRLVDDASTETADPKPDISGRNAGGVEKINT